MKVNTPQDIGLIIRDARKKRKWTQAELASKVGMFQKDISRIETDPAKVHLVTLLNVCAVLNIKLMTESDTFKAAGSHADGEDKRKVLNF